MAPSVEFVVGTLNYDIRKDRWVLGTEAFCAHGSTCLLKTTSVRDDPYLNSSSPIECRVLEKYDSEGDRTFTIEKDRNSDGKP
jgi:hypothetical protein